MSAAERYVQFMAERAQPPPLTSGDTRHWDGLSVASHSIMLTARSEPGAPAAVPAQAHAVPRGQDRLSATPTRPPHRIPVLPPPVIDWTTEAQRLTLYLDLAFLLAPPGGVASVVTGVLMWVLREGHDGERSLSTVSPALLVQTAAAVRSVAWVELVPHLPANDPLLHHMALVLQTCHDADGLASRLYAEALADALAVHFLRRYRTCGHTAPEVLDGLSPAKLRRATTYIAAHLEDALPLATLAAVVEMSPNHFASLFKRATGQTPRQYVLGCRIQRAKQLLTETAAPLSVIGPQVGWTDQSYFTALFRKHVAMTPKAYREATQQA